MQFRGIAAWRWGVAIVLLLAVFAVVYIGGGRWGWSYLAKLMVSGLGGLSISLAFLR